MKSREDLRGRPLGRYCNNANTDCDAKGNVYCYGLYEDDEGNMERECLKCGAYVYGAAASPEEE